MKTKPLFTILLLVVALGAACFVGHLLLQQSRQRQLAQAVFVGDLAAVKQCVEAGVVLDRGSAQRDGSIGLPPLTIAAMAGHEDIVRYLLDHGANPNQRGMSNPLIVACWRQHYAIAKLLLERGADPNARGEGTPLYAAESTNQTDLVALLKQHGAQK